MTIQITKTRPITDTARCIRDSIVNGGIRRLSEYAGMEMDNTEFIVTQMELAAYIKKTHWGHYMLTTASIEAL